MLLILLLIIVTIFKGGTNGAAASNCAILKIDETGGSPTYKVSVKNGICIKAICIKRKRNENLYILGGQ